MPQLKHLSDNKDAVTPLSEVQVTKLKQLSLLSLASDSRTLPYGMPPDSFPSLIPAAYIAYVTQTSCLASWTSPTSANWKTSSSKPSMPALSKADSISATLASPSTALHREMCSLNPCRDCPSRWPSGATSLAVRSRCWMAASRTLELRSAFLTVLVCIRSY